MATEQGLYVRGESIITYIEEKWDLYICHLLMQVREYKNDISHDMKLIEKKHYLESLLFRADNPDAAFDFVLDLMKSNSDADHGGKFDLREYECLGIFDLDNTQISADDLREQVSESYGFTVDCIDIENIDIEKFTGIPDRRRLKLFNKFNKIR